MDDSIEHSLIQVLIIEDNVNHFELIRRFLERDGRFQAIWKRNLRSAIEWLADHRPDIIICDWKLPDGEPSQLTLTLPDPECCPIIVQTAFGNEELVVKALKNGAVDYIPKSEENFKKLPEILLKNLTEWQRKAERQRQDVKKRHLEAISKIVVERAQTGILFVDQQGIIQIANPYLYELLEIEPYPSLEGVPLETSWLPHKALTLQKIQELRANPPLTFILYNIEIHSQKRLQVRLSPVHSAEQNTDGFVALFWDISLLERQKRILDSLYQVSNIHPENANFYPTLENALRNILSFDHICAGWKAEANGDLYIEYCSNGDTQPCLTVFRSLFDYALQYLQPFSFTQDDIALLNKQESADLPAGVLIVPIQDRFTNRKGAIGLLADQGQRPFAISDLLAAEIVVAQFMRTKERIYLEKKEKQERQTAQTLLNITHAFAQSLELEDVLENMGHHLRQLFQLEDLQVWLTDESFVLLAYDRAESVKARSERYALKDIPFLMSIHRQGSPLLTERGAWTGVEHSLLPAAPYCWGIPLRARKTINGFLVLGLSEPNFDAQQLEILLAFADQAGQAIENARLFEDAQRLSIVDELTGLYNRRGLNLFGQREFERTQRFHQPLSVIFGDVDHFKQFNDRYSYQVGDQVLIQVGRIFLANLRQVDVSARYGGDEFCVILPQTSYAEAQEVIQRLRLTIARSPVAFGGQTYPFDMSLGATCLNPFDSGWQDVLIRASQEMQKVKQQRGIQERR